MMVARLLAPALLLSVATSAASQEGVRTGYVDVEGARLYYEEAGSGMPVVMIHGGYLDHRMWDGQFAPVAKRYRAIRYDVRAHGRSVSDSVPFADHEDLRRLLDGLGVEKAVIVGLSMGGQIAIDFTLTHPERVAGLMLVASGLSGFQPHSEEIMRYVEDMRAARAQGLPATYEMFTRWFCDGPYRQPSDVDPVVRRKVLDMLETSEQRWFRPGLQRPPTPPAVGRLGEIRVPTMVVVGSLDVPDIHDIAELIVQDVPGAKRVDIQDVAHMVNMEKPVEFNAVLMPFLARVEVGLR